MQVPKNDALFYQVDFFVLVSVDFINTMCIWPKLNVFLVNHYQQMTDRTSLGEEYIVKNSWWQKPSLVKKQIFNWFILCAQVVKSHPFQFT